MTFQLFLLFCVVQLSYGEHLFDYYVCYDKHEEAKKEYEQKWQDYKEYMQPFQEKSLHYIDEKLVEMKLNSKCINQYYKNYTSLDYYNLGLGLCAITSPLDDYSPPWLADPSLVYQIACRFLSVRGKIGWDLMRHNRRLIRRCHVEDWFDRLMYHEWRECSGIK